MISIILTPTRSIFVFCKEEEEEETHTHTRKEEKTKWLCVYKYKQANNEIVSDVFRRTISIIGRHQSLVLILEMIDHVVWLNVHVLSIEEY